MNIFFYILMTISLLGIIPFLIIFIIQAARKKRKAVWGFTSLGCVVGTILFAMIGGLLTPVCDHEYKLIDEQAVTCTEDGFKSYKCEKCGNFKTEKEKALGHNMEEVSTKEATDTEDGEIELKCTRCGYTETKLIPKPTKNKPTETEKPKATQTPTQKPTEKPTQTPPTEAPTLSYEEEVEKYKENCSEISYEDLARNPEKYKGDCFVFTGEVIQVLEPTFGKKTTLRVNVTEEKYDYLDESIWKDTVYCTVTIPDGEDRILEEDIITFWGECQGLTSYTSVLGQKVSIPEIKIYTYEIKG